MRRLAFGLCVVACFALGCGQKAPPQTSSTSPPTPAPAAGQQPAVPSAPANGTAGDPKSPEKPGDATAATTPGPGDKPAEPKKDSLDAAQEAFDEGETDKGLAILDRVIAAGGEEVRGALMTKARQLQSMAHPLVKREPAEAIKKYQEILAVYKEVETRHGPLFPFEESQRATDQYDLACSLAIAGKPEEALAMLKTAYKGGFDNLDHIQADVDLESVQKLPEFKEFIETSIEERKKAVVTRLAAFAPIDVALEVTDIAGKKHSLADLKGKVVLLDCWATWCGPCLAMLPTMKELHAKHKEAGLVVIGLNFEAGDDKAETLKKFLEERPIPYPCAIAGTEVEEALPAFGGIPTWFFVGRDGKIRYRKTGAGASFELDVVIQELLKEKAE